MPVKHRLPEGELARRLEEPVRISCARCSASRDLPLLEARAWFATHRCRARPRRATGAPPTAYGARPPDERPRRPRPRSGYMSVVT